MARLADPQALMAGRRAACREICGAMSAHPQLVAGSGRPCTAIMTAAPEVVVKTGAEGVYAAALPALGLGLALKVEDGGGRRAGRADRPARGARRLAGAGGRLAELARPVLRNHAREVVGRIEPAPGWPGF